MTILCSIYLVQANRTLSFIDILLYLALYRTILLPKTEQNKPNKTEQHKE